MCDFLYSVSSHAFRPASNARSPLRTESSGLVASTQDKLFKTPDKSSSSSGIFLMASS